MGLQDRDWYRQALAQREADKADKRNRERLAQWLAEKKASQPVEIHWVLSLLLALSICAVMFGVLKFVVWLRY